MDTHTSGPFSSRIDEKRLAEILAMIAAPPNRRFRPIEGDLVGDFDFWFDGGACHTHTGSQHYVFADGTEAHRVFPATRLNVNVVFPNGEIADIAQRPPTGNEETRLACFRLDKLQQRDP